MYATATRKGRTATARRAAVMRRWDEQPSRAPVAARTPQALMQLQASAGNRAVGALLGRQPVQRCGEIPADECPCHASDAQPAVARQAESCPPGRVWDDPPGRCFSRTPNGCGPEGKWYSRFIPNGIAGLYDFEGACNRHDICYGTPFKTQQQCDDEFLRGMRASCRHYIRYGPRRYLGCLSAAQIYYTAVSRGGAEAFRSAQGL